MIHKIYIHSFYKYNIGDNITDKDIIVSDFKKIDKGLKPIINEWIQDNPVDLRATIYFFASLLKELLVDLQHKDFTPFDRFRESVIFFILEDK